MQQTLSLTCTFASSTWRRKGNALPLGVMKARLTTSNHLLKLFFLFTFASLIVSVFTSSAIRDVPLLPLEAIRLAFVCRALCAWALWVLSSSTTCCGRGEGWQ